MKHLQRVAVAGLLFLGIFACNADPDTPPEEVLRMYQAYVDQNEFTKAASLSTPAEAKRLSDLQQMIGEDTEEAILYTSFESIDCTVKSDSAFCDCQLKDQYEAYPASFVLIKVQNEWLVDLPGEEDIEYDEEIEYILDSLLNEELDKN